MLLDLQLIKAFLPKVQLFSTIKTSTLQPLETEILQFEKYNDKRGRFLVDSKPYGNPRKLH